MSKPTAYTNPILSGHSADTNTLNAAFSNHGNAINNGNHDPNDASNGYGGPIPQWGLTNTKYGAYSIGSAHAAIPADPNEVAVSPAGSITMDMGVAVELQRIRGQLARIMGTSQTRAITTPVTAGSNVTLTFSSPITGTNVLLAGQSVTLAQGGTSEVVSVASVNTSGGNTTGFVASSVANSYLTAGGTLNATFGGRWNDPILNGFANLSGNVQTGSLHITGSFTSDSGQFVSSVAVGTAPLSVVSTTMVANLCSQYLGAGAGSYGTSGPYGAVKSASGDVGGSTSKYTYAIPIMSGNGFLSPGMIEYDSAEASSFDTLTAGTSSAVNSLNRIRYQLLQIAKACGGSAWTQMPTTLVTGLQPTGSSVLSGTIGVVGGVGIAVNAVNGQLQISNTGAMPAAPGDVTYADLWADGVLADLASTYVPTPSVDATLAGLAGGSLSGTVYVRFTWAGEATNESLPRAEQSIVLAAGSKLQITLPAAPVGAGISVTTGNIYVSTSSGTETLQGSAAPGGTLTLSSLTSGSALPTTGLAIAQHTGSAYVGGQRASLVGAVMDLTSGIASGASPVTNYVDWNGNSGAASFSINSSASPSAGYLRLASFTAQNNAITSWTDLRVGPALVPTAYGMTIGKSTSKMAFFGGTAVAKPSVTGALSAVTDANAKAVLTSLLAALAASNLNLLTQSTT